MKDTIHFLREWRESLGLSQWDVAGLLEDLANTPEYAENRRAKAAGKSYSVIGKMERGASPASDIQIEMLAKVYKTTPDRLLRKPDDTNSGAQKSDHYLSPYGSMSSGDVNDTRQNTPLRRVRVTHNVPLIGKAEAGAFRAMFNDDVPIEAYIPIDAPEFEGVDLFAYEVSGLSMNEVFREGDRVICQAFKPKDLRDRDFVILRDTKGALAEISIKEFRIAGKGQWEFWPRSTDARYQQPVSIPERNDFQQSGIEIIGIVLFEAPAPIRRVGRFAVRP